MAARENFVTVVRIDSVVMCSALETKGSASSRLYVMLSVRHTGYFHRKFC